MPKINIKPFKKYKESHKEWNINLTIETISKKSELNSKFCKLSLEKIKTKTNFHFISIFTFNLSQFYSFFIEIIKLMT